MRLWNETDGANKYDTEYLWELYILFDDGFLFERNVFKDSSAIHDYVAFSFMLIYIHNYVVTLILTGGGGGGRSTPCSASDYLPVQILRWFVAKLN